MDEHRSVTGSVQRHLKGDPGAVDELYAHYAQGLGRLAEQHLSRKLASRVDGDDVVQSVFRTFFRRVREGEFKIDSGAQLWRLLVRITVLKARQQGRRHTAAVRDVGAEQRGADEDWLMAAAAREPGPEEAAILADQIEVLLQGLPSLYGNLLELRLQGYSTREMARQLGVSRQTVCRALEVLQHRLEKKF
jgi:RNA polymerase sigma-70 factor (ECF subfamily)